MLVPASQPTQPSTSSEPMQETGGTLRAPLPPISSQSANRDVILEFAAALIWQTNAGLEFT